MQVSHPSGSDLVETEWVRWRTWLEILERRAPWLSETSPKAECECKQTWHSHLPAAHLDSGPRDTTWWLSVERSLHPVKMMLLLWFSRGKVERAVQQSCTCWSHHSQPLGEPSGLWGGVDTFHFHVAFFGQTAPQLDREWHLARASWPLSRFLHPCMWNDCLVRWDSRWGQAESAVANRSVPPESVYPSALPAPGSGLAAEQVTLPPQDWECSKSPAYCGGHHLGALISLFEAISGSPCPVLTRPTFCGH